MSNSQQYVWVCRIETDFGHVPMAFDPTGTERHFPTRQEAVAYGKNAACVARILLSDVERVELVECERGDDTVEVIL